MAKKPETAESVLSSLDNFLVKLEDFRFDKQIGKGAYGEVWLALHRPTNTSCAVKKLLIEKLEGQQLTYFCREVMILARIHDFFLLPFLGFTSTSPYSIVTEFVPRGSLFDALQHKAGSPSLTSTNKTVIAMGIAQGMRSLHHQKIIHRDLKSLNILLDENILPKICDFGVARYMGDETTNVTQSIGTPHWMAPELFQSNRYTDKVDVYAFGILLWEMLTEQIPYHGMNGVEVAMAVVNQKQRPLIPTGTPKLLSQLIQLCWAQDPAKRPSFNQVLKAFAEKGVTFDGTDSAAVQSMAQFIDQKEKEDSNFSSLLNTRAKNQSPTANGKIEIQPPNPSYQPLSFPSNPQPLAPSQVKSTFQPPSFISPQPQSKPTIQQSQSILPQVDNQRLKPAFQPSQKPADQKPQFQPLYSNNTIKSYKFGDPNDKSFIQSIRTTIAVALVDTSAQLFTTLIPYFSPDTPSSSLAVIMDELLTLFDKDPKFVSQFVESKLYAYLPLTLSDIFPTTEKVVSAVIRELPEVISSDMTQIILYHTTKHPSQVLHLFSEFASSFERNANGNEIMNAYLQICSQILELGNGGDLLRILYFLYTKVNPPSEKLLNSLSEVCSQILASGGDKESALYVLIKAKIQRPPMDLIISCLDDPLICEAALAALTTYPSLPSNENLIKKVEMHKELKAADALLYRICEAESGAIILLSTGFLNGESDFVLKILLIISASTEVRRRLIADPNLVKTLSKISGDPNEERLSALCAICTAIGKSKEGIERLNEGGFLNSMVKHIIEGGNFSVVRDCLSMIDSIGRIGFSPSFSELVPHISGLFQSELCVQTLTAVIVINCFPQIHNQIRTKEVLDALKALNAPPDYEKYKNSLLKNLASA